MNVESTRPLLSVVFVDYDNIYMSLRRKNEEAAKRFAKDANLWLREIESGRLITGTNGASFENPRRIVMSRCYGNPVPRRNTGDNSTDMNSFPFIRHHFLRTGFEVIDCPPLTAQLKNSADIRMVMDVRDVMNHETRFDEFIILSGDADFTPLLHRLRAHARRTVVFANDHTAVPYTALSDGEVREGDLINLLLEGRMLAASEPKIAGELRGPATQADLETLRREIVAEVAQIVRQAPQPVPLEALADRTVRTLGHDRTVASSWGGAGSFRDLLLKALPADIRLSDQAPYYAYLASREVTTRPEVRQELRAERTLENHHTPEQRAPAHRGPDPRTQEPRVQAERFADSRADAKYAEPLLPEARPVARPDIHLDLRDDRSIDPRQDVRPQLRKEAARETRVPLQDDPRRSGADAYAQDRYDHRSLPQNLRIEAAIPTPAAAAPRAPQSAAGLLEMSTARAPNYAPAPTYTQPASPRQPTTQREPMTPDLAAPKQSPTAQAPAASATQLQQSIARIHEACQAPPLSPPEYRILFEVMAEEINTNNLAGTQTLINIAKRALDLGVETRRDDIRFVLEVVSEADPWFEQGASANLFASRFRNFVVARCRAQGLTLSADEIDLVDAWFGGAAPAPRAQQTPAPQAYQQQAAPRANTQERYRDEPQFAPMAQPSGPDLYRNDGDDEFPRIVRSRLRG